MLRSLVATNHMAALYKQMHTSSHLQAHGHYGYPCIKTTLVAMCVKRVNSNLQT